METSTSMYHPVYFTLIPRRGFCGLRCFSPLLLGQSEALTRLLLEGAVGALFPKARFIISQLSRAGRKAGKRAPSLPREGSVPGEPWGAAHPLPPLRRANALEEQLKEQELRADQTLLEEIKKQRELLSKMEREKSIEIENLQAR